MQVIQAAKALAAQLSALDLLACRGTQSLSVPCEVEDLVGWLNAQRVTPRLYWQPREASAAGYAVLGEARAFDSLVALQVDWLIGAGAVGTLEAAAGAGIGSACEERCAITASSRALLKSGSLLLLAMASTKSFKSTCNSTLMPPFKSRPMASWLFFRSA